MRGKLKAKNEQIPVWTASDIGVEENDAGLAGSFTQVIKIFTPKHEYEVKMIEGNSEEQSDELFKKLRELNLV